MPLRQNLTCWYRQIPVKKFNRICFIIALLWLMLSIPIGIILRPTITDFGQFYMGGLIASRGDWDALYPFPIHGSLDNAGLKMHSHAKPKWSYLSRTSGIFDYTHFILPPPSALLFIPFSFLSFNQAFWVWTFMLILCSWGVSIIAGRLLRPILRHPSRTEGYLSLFIVLSPMTARAIRIANVSPIIALLLGIALLALVEQKHTMRGAWSVLLGAVFKYATLIFTPLLFAMRQWRMLFWITFFGVLVLVGTLTITGPAVYIEFIQSVRPTLSRPSAFLGNQSLQGMLARVFGRPFSIQLSFILNFICLSSFGLVLKSLNRIQSHQWKDPVHILAATGLLVSWLMIFSPITWEHWPIFLCPIWGWLYWESRKSKTQRIFVWASLVLMYFPAGIIQVGGIATFPVTFPEPFNSTQLFGVIILFGISYRRLNRPHLAYSLALVPKERLREPLAIEELLQVRNLEYGKKQGEAKY